MPNYAKQEREMLSPEELALAEQSRQPQLRQLSATKLKQLIAALGKARDAASTDEDAQGTSPASLLRAALRRAEVERRKRGSDAPMRPVAPATRPPKAPRARPVNGRKPATPRKTDQRTEPHRVARPAPPPADAGQDPDTRNEAMQNPDAEKQARQSARKAEKDAAKEAEKNIAREARRAERQAAKQAEKDAAREERRAARKAANTAARKDAKDAGKAERKAARKAEKKSRSAEDLAAEARTLAEAAEAKAAEALAAAAALIEGAGGGKKAKKKKKKTD